MAISSATDPSDVQHRVQLRRAVVAGTVGTIIEAYDFLLYVQVAPLVFAKLYFPSSDPLVGTLQAFGIYAVGAARGSAGTTRRRRSRHPPGDVLKCPPIHTDRGRFSNAIGLCGGLLTQSCTRGRGASH
jgi:hypothetical protein